MSLLVIDPGVRGCGCSLWHGTGLVRAEYVLGPKAVERALCWAGMAESVVTRFSAAGVDSLVIEAPRTYGGRSSRGDTQDLLDLSAVVGAICFAYRELPTTVYYPQEHKGQLPKAIAHQRALKRLSQAEAGAIMLPSAKSLAHNVYDAVQIGLTHLKRM